MGSKTTSKTLNGQTYLKNSFSYDLKKDVLENIIKIPDVGKVDLYS